MWKALLDYMDVSELNVKLNKPWNGVENSAMKFACNDSIEQQLIKAGLLNQQPLHHALILARVKATGEYNNVACERDRKPMADKTYANF